MSEGSKENKIGNLKGYSNIAAKDKQKCALIDEENTMNVKAGPAINLGEANLFD